jgi:hypothetical protein
MDEAGACIVSIAGFCFAERNEEAVNVFEILGALNGRVSFASFLSAVRDLLPDAEEAAGVWVSGI